MYNPLISGLLFALLKDRHRFSTLAPGDCAVHQNKTSERTASRPFQPWQVTRRQAAPTVAELREARQRVEVETRRTVQQQIIVQQRKLLKDQQEQIARLKEKQNAMGLRLEMEKPAQLSQLSVPGGTRPQSHSFNPREPR